MQDQTPDVDHHRSPWMTISLPSCAENQIHQPFSPDLKVWVLQGPEHCDSCWGSVSGLHATRGGTVILLDDIRLWLGSKETLKEAK